MLTVGEVLGLSPGTTLLVCARNYEARDEAFWLCDLLRCNPDNDTVHVQWYTVSQMSPFDPAPAARRWVKTPFQREVNACIVYQSVEVFAPGFRAYRLTEDSAQRFEDALNELAAEAGNPSSREVQAPGHGHNQRDGHGGRAGRRLARHGGTPRTSPVTSKGVN
jgi:hypothetical protein